VLVAVAAAAVATACQHDTAATPSAFYAWDDREVHCAINLDTYARNDLDSVKAGLDRALQRGEVIELYAHDPGRTVEWDALEAVLAAINERNLPYYTYADFARGVAPGGAGVALSFDDAYIDHWLNGADLYARYAARLTFFIAYYDELSIDQRASLHELALRGHAIEAHSVDHLRAPVYVERHGLAAYIDNEVKPSIEVLRAEGFDVTTFAYPYGARTGEIDRAVLAHVPLVRSVSFTWSSIATDPCPH
jgi:peptidoglycan/xylan/chitin deacetylase (PgdA/CDA1 family)